MISSALNTHLVMSWFGSVLAAEYIAVDMPITSAMMSNVKETQY